MKNLNRNMLIFCSIAIICGCASKKNTTPSELPEQERTEVLKLTGEQIMANELELGHPDTSLFSRKVHATGYLEAIPENKQIVTARMGGTIRNLRLLPGDYVKAGHPLFTLENQEFIALQEEFLTSTESLKFLKDDLERQKLLSGENAASRKILQRTEADYISASARVNALKSKLALVFIDPGKINPENIRAQTVIPAPISGYITRKNGENGQYVSDQTSILEIVHPDPLLLRLAVFEKDILQVNDGQMVQFTLPDASDEIFKARVVKSGKSLNVNRTVEVTAFFDNRKSPLKLIPGMFAKAEIITGEFRSLSLPVSAVVEIDNQKIVLVKTNPESDFWILEKVQVELGTLDGDIVEILPGSPLKPGQSVVTKGAFGIINI